MTNRFDALIIGGGIVGTATARALLARHWGPVGLLEAESELARHQTGHNSGVIHSGLYYRPGSLKAVNCREGKRAIEVFCRAEGIAMETCGKVIVEMDAAEEERLRGLYDRGLRNGVKCEWIGAERLKELEPHAAGIAAVQVPETGIVDYVAVCERLAARIE